MRVLVALGLLSTASVAWAQRADDNAAREADDAFGKSVGNERVGIYNPFDVRGFSPFDAGNVRIEGLYFDPQTGVTDRLVDGSTVRVGLSAQSYPFPAPTGIADYALRRPGDKRLVSPVVVAGPYGGWSAEFDAQVPIVKDRLGVAFGSGLYRSHEHYGATPHYFSLSVAPRWTPAPGAEVIAFYSRIRSTSEEPQPLVFTSGDFFPPKIARRNYYGQRWARNAGTGQNYGVLGGWTTGPWSLRAGLFRSSYDLDRGFNALFTGVDRAGRGNEIVIARADNRSASTSGEVRVARTFDEGPRRHTLTASLRGRDSARSYGGDQVLDLGPAVIGEADPVPEPVFGFGAKSRDTIRQGTAGLSYGLNWARVGEVSVGIQKTDYRRTSAEPGRVRPTSTDSPWLINATAAANLSHSIVVYAGFTRGLEESPDAPDNAVNRNDAPPAIRTRQYDAGVRWAIRPDLKLIAGVFEVTKPFYDLNPADVFEVVGTVRNRGVELSLAGTLAKGLNLVAGTVFLDPVVSGAARDRGELGPRPVAAILRNSFASLDYRFPDSGFSIDAVGESTGKRVANSENSFFVPPRAVLSLGGRYRFKAGDTPVTVRAQVGNVFDNYGFGVGGGGLIVYNLPQRLTINVAADI